MLGISHAVVLYACLRGLYLVAVQDHGAVLQLEGKRTGFSQLLQNGVGV